MQERLEGYICLDVVRLSFTESELTCRPFRASRYRVHVPLKTLAAIELSRGKGVTVSPEWFFEFLWLVQRL